MVVDPDVEIGEVFGRNDEHRGGLATAPVTAGSLAGVHGRHEAFGKATRGGEVGRQGVSNHGRVCKHIASHADSWGGGAAAPCDAIVTCPGGRMAVAVDRMQLAQRAAFVAGQDSVDGELRGEAAFERIESGGAEIAIGNRLRGNGPNARPECRNTCTHGEILGGDSKPKRAGFTVIGKDGPSHRNLHVTGTGPPKPDTINFVCIQPTVDQALRAFQNSGKGDLMTPVTLVRRAIGWNPWPSGK